MAQVSLLLFIEIGPAFLANEIAECCERAEGKHSEHKNAGENPIKSF